MSQSRATLGCAILAGAAAALIAVFACDDTPVCVPGTTEVGCPCGTGGAGYEVCKPNGLGYGACLCGVPEGGGSPTDDGGEGGSPDGDDAPEADGATSDESSPPVPGVALDAGDGSMEAADGAPAD